MTTIRCSYFPLLEMQLISAKKHVSKDIWTNLSSYPLPIYAKKITRIRRGMLVNVKQVVKRFPNTKETCYSRFINLCTSYGDVLTCAHPMEIYWLVRILWSSLSCCRKFYLFMLSKIASCVPLPIMVNKVPSRRKGILFWTSSFQRIRSVRLLVLECNIVVHEIIQDCYVTCLLKTILGIP